MVHPSAAGACFVLAAAILACGCGDSLPPEITVTYPNGGVGWYIGGADPEITWTSTSHPWNVDIHYTTDATGDPETWTWLVVALDVPNTGSHAWSVQGPLSNACRIRVRTAGGGGVEDVSDADLVIAGCMITSPVGGEVWPVNSAQTITWTSLYVTTVDIELSLDGNWEDGDGSDVLTICTGWPASSESYSWMIWEPESTSCLIRISNTAPATGKAISPATFSMVPEAPGPACYVRSDADPGGDGLSWDTAHDSIGDAMGSDREIWVAKGTYTGLVSVGAKTRLYGGFAGTETSRDERNWVANETILDGENVSACMLGTNVDEFVLDGFTVTRGMGVDTPDMWYGGAVGIRGRNMRIANCLFADNTPDSGGALVAFVGGRLLVEDCVFSSNYSDQSGGAAHIFNGTWGFVWFSNCAFSGNSTDFRGGAVRVLGGSFAHFSDCAFEGNIAAGLVTGVPPEQYEGGGAVSIEAWDALLERCTFSDNTVTTPGCPGGGLDACCNLVMSSCTFVGNSASAGGGVSVADHDDLHYLITNGRISNCVFSGNTADQGGGIYSGLGVVDLSVWNCTLAGNSATDTGGGIEIGTPPSGSCTLGNLIVWGNTAITAGDAILDPYAAGVVTYSCIDQAGYAGTGGSIDLDPLFVDADGADDTIGTADDDVSLEALSPCIDTGDPATTVATDIEGTPRPQGSGYDMGAYER